MFFLMSRSDTLALHPKFFAGDVKEQILKELKQKVQGKCSVTFQPLSASFDYLHAHRGSTDTPYW